jgi:hypothetical protein
MDAVAAAAVNFDQADEVREADKAKIMIVNTPNGSVAKMELQPGWRWEDSIKPIVGTDSCQATHFGYIEAGQMRIIPDDGEEVTFSAGDTMMLMSGHHAEVVGDEVFVAYEFSGPTVEHYATAGE